MGAPALGLEAGPTELPAGAFSTFAEPASAPGAAGTEPSTALSSPWEPTAAPAGALLKDAWRREAALPVPGAGEVLVFGQMKGAGEGAPVQSGGTATDAGLAWRLPVSTDAELLLGCGPELAATTAAPGRAQSGAPSAVRAQWLRLDVQCRWALPGSVGLECQGTTCPALEPGDHHVLSQELRAVVPVGGGQFRLGARHSWEDGGGSKSGADSMELFGGFRLGW